jgi:hypothetical protein
MTCVCSALAFESVLELCAGSASYMHCGGISTRANGHQHLCPGKHGHQLIIVRQCTAPAKAHSQNQCHDHCSAQLPCSMPVQMYALVHRTCCARARASESCMIDPRRARAVTITPWRCQSKVLILTSRQQLTMGRTVRAQPFPSPFLPMPLTLLASHQPLNARELHCVIAAARHCLRVLPLPVVC